MASQDRRSRRAVVAAGIGTVVEYYDLTVYAYLAVVVSPLFFPSDDPTASLLSSLAVFASAYLMRPIGGIFFGRLGDRFGRKRALLVSVILMGVGTTLMALLPTYAAVGVLAPILLVIARLLQGFSAGGELGGALTYVYEIVGPKRRGLGGSIVALGSNSGFALAAIVVATTSALTSEAQMDSWGWRIPFVAGLPLLVLCLWLRTRIEDSPEFTKTAERRELPKAPLRELLRSQPAQVLQVLGLGIAQNATGYMVLTYIGIHLVREGGYSQTAVTWTAAGVIVFIASCMPLAGILVDRFGSRPVLIAGLLTAATLAYPAMALMTGHGLAVAAIAFAVFALCTPLIQVATAPLFPSLFDTKVRLTGVALGFNLSTVLAGGTAAYIATWLIDRTDNSLSPAYFLIGSSAIGLLTLLTIRRKRRGLGEAGDAADDTPAVPART
ncbi:MULTISPECIES: MFS transporter [unclassified Gordonia (in: high G+C Gram-positive bacteria)]|uniref:MFS transporter n=1 Tax=unclassified Gordonia (in: high G+C Gram-positive bacteria) TaxID=2657482 RepID=UPI00080E07A2|nr:MULTISPECIES: MFS transporter [unclassified Gordonia (in: high G+C Gram-positive bacteria)]OCH82728.1 MFS transporter [Gordonia sp. UCD-TK1]WGJ85455.1 MFS transporter [Gordonia sp. SMJS1]